MASSSNLAFNGSFENEEGWNLTLHRGAQGAISQTSPGRTGEHALRLKVENSEGHLLLRSAKPIRVKPGVTYTFRGWFRAENAPIGSLLLFRVGSITTPLRYDSIDRSAGWSSQSLVINTPPGRWEQRTITFKSTREQDVYLSLVALGNPFEVVVDDLEFEEGTPPVAPAQEEPYPFPNSAQEVADILAERPVATARLARDGARTTLLVEERPSVPVLYKGLESNRERGDYAGFQQAGVPLSVTTVRLGPSSFYPDAIWLGPGKYNIAALDEALLSVLRKDPQARIILDLWLYPYPQWGDEHRSEVMRKPNGQIVRTKAFNHSGTLPQEAETFYTPETKEHAYPSIHSLKWRADLREALEAITAHLKTSPYGKAVAGFFISSGQDGQFIYTGTDDSEPGRRAFHQWLEKRFGTVAQLNDALGTQFERFEAIPLPDYDDLPAAQRHTRAPYIGGVRPLYGEFKEETAWAVRDEFAGILKAGMERPMLALAYGTPITRYLYQTKHLDGAGTMTYYPFRNPGHAIGFNPGNGAQRHGKLIFQEIDLRSYSGSRYGEVYQRWIGAGDTPERWDAIHRHLVGLSLVNGFGYWYYDMRNYFQSPQMKEGIAQALKVTQALAARPAPSFRPDVVVVTTDVGDSHMANRYTGSLYANIATIHQTILVSHGWMLNSSGVPYHVHDLDDILSDPELQDYKVYLFHQSPYLSASQREGIRTKLAGGGRTLVWLFDTGYMSEKGPDIATQSELVGMRLQTGEEPSRRTLALKPDAHPYTQGVLPRQSLSDTLASIFSLQGAGEYGYAYLPFSVDDPGATVFGHYRETQDAAAAVRKFDTWTSVYLGAPNSLGSDLLHRIASEAGAFVAGPPGQSLVMNGDFVSIHALKTTEAYPLTLPPGRTTVRDALSGEIISKGKESVVLSLQAQKTYWFTLEE